MKLTVEERGILRRSERAQRRLERTIPAGTLYDPKFVLNNPVPAGCLGCGYYWTNRDAIKSPTLLNCACFWCGGRLIALDQVAYAERLNNLHPHSVPYQPQLSFQE